MRAYFELYWPRHFGAVPCTAVPQNKDTSGRTKTCN